MRLSILLNFPFSCLSLTILSANFWPRPGKAFKSSGLARFKSILRPKTSWPAPLKLSGILVSAGKRFSSSLKGPCQRWIQKNKSASKRVRIAARAREFLFSEAFVFKILHEFIINTIHECHPRSLDNIFRNSHCAPFIGAIGRFDEHANLGAGAFP